MKFVQLLSNIPYIVVEKHGYIHSGNESYLLNTIFFSSHGDAWIVGLGTSLGEVIETSHKPKESKIGGF